jgi:Phosphodiester glycosidase
MVTQVSKEKTNKLKNFFQKHKMWLEFDSIILFLVSIVGIASFIFFQKISQQNAQLRAKTLQIKTLDTQGKNLSQQLEKAQKDLTELQNQDQYKINKDLQTNIKNIEDTYSQAKTLYEKLLDLKTQVKDTKSLDSLFAESLQFLSQKNYSSASADLKDLADGIQAQEDKLVTAFTIPANVPANNNAPGSGFSQQTVTSDTGTFLVSIIAADLNSTRVIVDTASDNDCSNNCPVLSLGDYVSRNGAFAGINGTFFCPAEYPSCAGKTGSFDTLLMNKNKHYFNSANNVYSTVPLVYFTGNTMGVRGRSSDWGRDTGVDSVIAMQPLLISGGNIAYESSSDTKFTNKGTRDFIANKGSTVYIGVMFNANMTDAAHVLKTMGMDNALNLDEGGSTALWYGGYKAGPGRNIPNAVLFVRK